MNGEPQYHRKPYVLIPSPNKTNPRLRDLASCKTETPRWEKTIKNENLRPITRITKASEIGSKVAETHEFLGNIRHP